MRAMITVLAVGILAAGCSKQNAATNTATPVTNTAAAEGNMSASGDFTPPSSLSRLDYGTRAERRFHKLDTNNDNKLSASELPSKRSAKIMKRADTNSDGFIDATEWSNAMLARFDKKDANKDGTLTAEERGKQGGKNGGKHGKRGGADDGSADAVSNATMDSGGDDLGEF